MNVNLEERQTAGKRIRVEHSWDGLWNGRSLEGMIQQLADDGYNFAGKVDEYISTGISRSMAAYLFIKAEEDE